MPSTDSIVHETEEVNEIRVATKIAVSPRTIPPKTPVRLVIPSLGINSSITAMGRDANGVMGVPRGAHGISWFNISAFPGYRTDRIVNAIFAGHNVWNSVPGTFANLHTITIGATVHIHYHDRTVGQFQVISSDCYPLDGVPISVMSRVGGSVRTTLITCSGERTPAGFNRRHVVILEAVSLPS
jgi:hypothetical protein